ncbi:MAG TPA: hypothetical protein VJ747_09540 [Stellaceae bacterium]|nr:hypothetical protein [Stellaceae bacterium]
MSRTGTPSRSPPEPRDELPYSVELWRAEGDAAVERVLARASSAQLAHAIFAAARSEHPGRRITLQQGSRIIADSAG